MRLMSIWFWERSPPTLSSTHRWRHVLAGVGITNPVAGIVTGTKDGTRTLTHRDAQREYPIHGKRLSEDDGG